MSMILGLTAVSDSNIERMLEDPPLLWKVLAPDDPEVYRDARSAAGSRGLFSRLLGLAKMKGTRGASKDLTLGAEEGDGIDLDKAWHGLHYLLTGTACDGEPPLNFLLCSGQQIGDIDVGYGPARSFFAAEAVEIRRALASIDDTELRARFNPEAMISLEIYPEIWGRDPAEDDTLGYLIEYFTILKECLDSIVERHQGFVVSIT